MSRSARRLGSTYRLQLYGLGFGGARRLVPYLRALGIETLYVSPVLAAAPGSTHGYDVVDPTRLDPALGTPEDLEALLGALDDHDMGLLLDVVPNHMAAVEQNRWWWDVLARGRGSEHAAVFDVDWAAQEGRVLLPFLSVPLGELVRRGSVHLDAARGVVSVGDAAFPLDPVSVADAADDVAAVLARQHYRLAYWRLGPAEGNYRRFFDIDRLVGVRQEDPAVYRATHRLVLELAADRRVAGLRIDHVDGLADPAGYLARLAADLDARRDVPATIVVEKILGHDEQLPEGWDVAGTTGYEFADLTTRLFVDPAGAEALERLGARLGGADATFEEISVGACRDVLDTLFPGALDRLAALAARSLDERAPGHDLSLPALRRALGALSTHLGAYRTYIGRGPVRRADRERLARAVMGARADLDAEGGRALDTVVGLLGDDAVDTELAARWQQLTGAVAAKGVEDTACYRYDGLLAAAEVGGDPGRPSVSVEEFHRAMAARARRGAGGLNALSTHDTKRSADVRARLAALSEDAGEWARLVRRWHRRHSPAAAGVDPHDALFFYQSLLGLWNPSDAGRGLSERLTTSMRKAAREAKRETSWLDPDRAYEAVLSSWIGRVLADDTTVAELGACLRRIGPAAATNSLAMVVLATTAPGVPDLYQGSELWDLALMDPDNRRPVDFVRRAEALARLAAPEDEAARRLAEVRRLLASWPDGLLKLSVTRSLLHLRRRWTEVFADGSYVPLETRGPHRAALVAFARRRGRRRTVTVVANRALSVAGRGRFAIGPEVWGNTTVVMPAGSPTRYRDALSGATVSARRGALGVGEMFAELPVSVLCADGREAT